MPNILFLAAFLLTLLYALARGGAAERVVCGLFVAGYVLSVMAATYEPAFAHVKVATLTIDALMGVAFTVIAICSTRYWPITLAALQWVAVMSHLARSLSAEMMPFPYAAMLKMLSWASLALVIGATLRHRKRLKRYGVDKSWKRSFTR